LHRRRGKESNQPFIEIIALAFHANGGRAAFVGPRGLLRAPLAACATAWRIG